MGVECRSRSSPGESASVRRAVPAPAGQGASVPLPRGLTDDERLALVALQEAHSAPPAGSSVWRFLESAGLVWVDRHVMPPTVRLTPDGRAYRVDER